ncbi:hypothetical protein IFR07_03535 [Pantoea agglomerans]|uniref:hypothetical protein n=1 Tax=Pantoea TaxID=53335 RepID=UPI0017832CB8|nr:hypothetical protein [Pantoea agglomerans]MBD8115966.1 hypothetical protein [Pantoea agglomerans]
MSYITNPKWPLNGPKYITKPKVSSTIKSNKARITTFTGGPEVQSVVAEFLTLDAESPTGLSWAKENHNKRHLVSYRSAGEPAGRKEGDTSLVIKGYRVTVQRAIEMLKAAQQGRVMANTHTQWVNTSGRHSESTKLGK